MAEGLDIDKFIRCVEAHSSTKKQLIISNIQNIQNYRVAIYANLNTLLTIDGIFDDDLVRLFTDLELIPIEFCCLNFRQICHLRMFRRCMLMLLYPVSRASGYLNDDCRNLQFTLIPNLVMNILPIEHLKNLIKDAVSNNPNLIGLKTDFQDLINPPPLSQRNPASTILYYNPSSPQSSRSLTFEAVNRVNAEVHESHNLNGRQRSIWDADFYVTEGESEGESKGEGEGESESERENEGTVIRVIDLANLDDNMWMDIIKNNHDKIFYELGIDPRNASTIERTIKISETILNMRKNYKLKFKVDENKVKSIFDDFIFNDAVDFITVLNLDNLYARYCRCHVDEVLLSGATKTYAKFIRTAKEIVLVTPQEAAYYNNRPRIRLMCELIDKFLNVGERTRNVRIDWLKKQILEINENEVDMFTVYEEIKKGQWKI